MKGITASIIEPLILDGIPVRAPDDPPQGIEVSKFGDFDMRTFFVIAATMRNDVVAAQNTHKQYDTSNIIALRLSG